MARVRRLRTRITTLALVEVVVRISRTSVRQISIVVPVINTTRNHSEMMIPRNLIFKLVEGAEPTTENEVFCPLNLPDLPIRLKNQPVGGRLEFYAKNWKQLGVDDHILDIRENGYNIEFVKKTPLTNSPLESSLPKDEVKRQVVLQMVEEFLEKKIIEEVVDVHSPGFYSRFNVVQKKSGKWRGILDLSILNKEYIRTQHFKMDSSETVRESLKKEEWATSIDLTDAYYHIKIHKSSRKFLRFVIGDRIFQFRTLVMGLAHSPRIFNMIVKAPRSFLHKHGLTIEQYLDDWLVHNLSKALLRRQTRFLIGITELLGFLINLEKSETVPKQVFMFLGYHYNLRDGVVCMTEEMFNKIEENINHFLVQGSCTAQQYQSLIGMLISVMRLVQNGRLHLRPIQYFLREIWKQTVETQEKIILLEDKMITHLRWWTDKGTVLKGVNLHWEEHQRQIYSDASLTGWGGHLDFMKVKGLWSEEEKVLHINVLELRAAFNVMCHFREQLESSSVLLCTDNTTVVAYVNHQGGMKSEAMMTETWRILQWSVENNILVKARHIPGCLNVIADEESRDHQIAGSEWSLLPSVLEMIWEVWEKPTVDLFATRFNNKMSLFISPIPDPLAIGVDSLSMSWKGMRGYAYPPPAILNKVLIKIEKEECVVVLIAPKWERMNWYPKLLALSVAEPIKLPHRKNLLRQPRTGIFHQNVQMLNLHAYLLSGKQTV
jgi:hypothetical protein